jgi:putative GTP pyrophosphokinase
MGAPSKTQIDRLGERLHLGGGAESDLKLLDAYRQSFAPQYQVVVAYLRGKLKLKPTGRPAKSTSSIADKLRRESVRLSQMQDIAGCRVVVKDVFAQNKVVNALKREFKGCVVQDRRRKPSYGYRAVHVLVPVDGKTVEVQIRTRLQHMWAEFSEKLSDVVDPSIKYGGGSADVRALLDNSSTLMGRVEDGAISLRALRSTARGTERHHPSARMHKAPTSSARVAWMVAENQKSQKELMRLFKVAMKMEWLKK